MGEAMDTKVLVIDTEKVDLVALSKILGVDLQAEIDKALGRECEDCGECEVEEELYDETFGNIEVEDDNSNRYKIGFKVEGATEVKVTEEDGGVEVFAMGPNGEEFVEFVEGPAAGFFPDQTTANLRKGVLTIRFYKTKPVKANLGRKITVNNW
jgi:HSP20 family molecular chaperone IbpA